MIRGAWLPARAVPWMMSALWNESGEDAMPIVPNEVRFALRRIRRSPGTTALILLALALAIGANATIFSLANTLLLRPLGARDSDTLVRVGTTTGDDRYGITSWPDYVDLREQTLGLEGLAATAWTQLGVRDEAGTDRVVGEMVTWNYWPVVGVAVERGRAFEPGEDRRGAASPVAIVSHGFWLGRLGGDPDVIGSTLRLSGEPYTVIGVAPAGFRGLSTVVHTDVWVPAMMVDRAFPWDVNLDGRVDPWLNLVGRLAPGAELEDVQASLNRVAARLEADYPDTNEGKTFTAVELDRSRVVPSQTTDGPIRAMAFFQLLMVLVLVVACLNVANLFLARATRRGRDVALQFAVGATRRRVMGDLLAEALLITVAAVVIGILAGQAGARLFWSLQPDLEIAAAADFGMDARVLLFAVGMTLLTTAAFGLAPALYTARRLGPSTLRNRAPGTTRGPTGQRFLVAGQVALSVLLLLAAGLFLRSFRATTQVDPGFDLRNGTISTINLGFIQYDEAEITGRLDRLKDRVRSIPGVASASYSLSVPLWSSGGRHDVRIPGYEPGPDEWMVFRRNMIDGDYLRTFGIDVVEGRGVDDRDRADSEPVTVVNETMARRYWPDGDAVGSILYADDGVARRLVGITADTRYQGLEEPPAPTLAIPLAQASFQPRVFLAVRAEGALEPVASAVRQEIAELLPDLPLTLVSVEQHIATAQGGARAASIIASFAALLALIVSLAGVYGVTAFTVSRRTHEFGVRMALGASATTVVRQVLREGIVTAAAGVLVGLALALAGGRLLEGLLFGVAVPDPLVFLSVGLTVAGAALLAVYAPARRAAHTHPVDILGVD